MRNGQPTQERAAAKTGLVDVLLVALAILLVALPLPAFMDTAEQAVRRIGLLALLVVPPIIALFMIQRRLGPGSELSGQSGAVNDPV
jgi:hypothetical protein